MSHYDVPITHSLLTVLSPKLIISNITNWGKLKNKQLHTKVLLNSFAVNGHILGLWPQNQKLENFVSPKVSIWGSKS